MLPKKQMQDDGAPAVGGRWMVHSWLCLQHQWKHQLLPPHSICSTAQAQGLGTGWQAVGTVMETVMGAAKGMEMRMTQAKAVWGWVRALATTAWAWAMRLAAEPGGCHTVRR